MADLAQPDRRLFVIHPDDVDDFLRCGGWPADAVYVLPAVDTPAVPLMTWLAMTGRQSLPADAASH